MRLLVCIPLAAMLLSGCARHYVRIAEGLTSPTIAEGIRVAPRMFSAPALVDACRTPVVVHRLRVEPDKLELARGTRYSLNSLSIVAVTRADIAVPGLPIVLEAEDADPAVLDLRSGDPDLAEGRILAVGPGEFRMRVRTICGTPYVETVIEGRVR